MRTSPFHTLHFEAALMTLALLLVSNLCCSRLAEAQAPDLKFERIGPDDGFPTVTTTAIHQDEAGFYWLETWAGLFRYDGYVFKAYINDPDDPSSISHNWISGLAIDHRGRFWVGTNGGGLNLFDRNRGTFKHFRHDPADPSSLSHDEVVRVIVSRRGDLWVATIGGLNRLWPDEAGFERFGGFVNFHRFYHLAVRSDNAGKKSNRFSCPRQRRSPRTRAHRCNPLP